MNFLNILSWHISWHSHGSNKLDLVDFGDDLRRGTTSYCMYCSKMWYMYSVIFHKLFI